MTPDMDFFPEQDKIVSHFTLSLVDGKPFDPDRFDIMTRQVGEKEGDKFGLKYLVIDDLMYVFPPTVNHDVLFWQLENMGNLTSAGHIFVQFYNDKVFMRQIINGSGTLRRASLLTNGDSEDYLDKTIMPILGEYFRKL
jgi:hypothetical protein